MGIDWSDEGIRQATELSKKGSFIGTLKFMVGDFYELSNLFKSESFDIISSYNALHLLMESRRSQAFDQYMKLLKPDGLLAFTVYSTKEAGYGEGEESETNSYIKKGQLVHFYEKEEIISLTRHLTTVSLEHIECFEDYPRDHYHQEWFYLGRRI